MSVQARADAGLKTSPSAAFLRQQQQPPPLFSGNGAAAAAEVDSVAGGGFALQHELPICTRTHALATKETDSSRINTPNAIPQNRQLCSRLRHDAIGPVSTVLQH